MPCEVLAQFLSLPCSRVAILGKQATSYTHRLHFDFVVAGEANQGVSMDRLLSDVDGGTRYLVTKKPLLSYILSMELLPCKKHGRHC
jgi:hypothetical protein